MVCAVCLSCAVCAWAPVSRVADPRPVTGPDELRMRCPHMHLGPALSTRTEVSVVPRLRVKISHGDDTGGFHFAELHNPKKKVECVPVEASA